MMIYRIISSKVNSYACTALKYKVAIPEGFPFLLTFKLRTEILKAY